MRAGMTSALAARLRRPDPTARLMIEAQVELPGADIRQTSVQWNNADAGEIGTTLTVLTDGGVQLANGASLIAQNPNGAGTYLPGLGAGNAVGVVNWFGDEGPNTEITFLTAFLNPRANVGNPRTATKWRCRLYQPVYQGSTSSAPFSLVPLCDPIDVAITADTAGDVTFDFRQLAQRPKPKAHNDFSLKGALNGAGTFVVITPLDASGKVAANCAWNQDPSNATVAYFNWRATALTLQSNIIATDVTLHFSGAVPANFPGTGYIKIDTEVIGFTAGSFLLAGELGNLQRGQFGTTAAGHTAGAAIFLGSHNDISAATIVPSLLDPGANARQATGGGAVRMAIETGSYSSATLRFSTHQIDLGSAPTAPVELTGLAEVPLGTSATFQVLKTGGSVGNPGDWLTFTDGMLTTDPSLGGLLTAAQTYKMQCLVAPNAAGSLTPTVRRMGARQVTRTNLSNVAQLKSGNWSFDPVTLKSALNDFLLTAIRDGERDYHDRITTLLANNPIGTILIRLWIGADDLTRDQWLHLDDLVIDDYAPGGAATDLVCQTGLSLVKQALPKFNTVASTRQPLSYPSISVPTASIDQVWLDLMQNQLGDVLGGRWVGQGPPAVTIPVPAPAAGSIAGSTAANPSVVATVAPHGRTGTFTVTIIGAADSTINGSWTATVVDSTHFSVPVLGLGGDAGGSWAYPGGTGTTVIVSKTITDSNPNPIPGQPATTDDAKLELDAIAYIAGFVNITSQGKIKAVDVFGSQAVKVIFTPEAIKPLTIAAGLRQRQAEAFVRWGWNGSFYQGEAYGVNAAALTKLGNATIDPTPLSDTISQWLVQQTGDPANQCGIANALATRIVSTFGTGLILWTFESTLPYPELELGDLVAVPTDWFVGTDPASGAAYSGPLYALAIVQSCEPNGRQFSVWTRSLSDLVAFALPATRTGFGTPSILTADYAADQNGNIAATVNCANAGACRVAASTSAFPNAAAVTAAPLQVLDSTGFVKTGTLLTLTYGQTCYVSVIAYANADGSGAATALYEVQLVSVHAWMNTQASIAATPIAGGNGFFSWAARGPANNQMWASFGWSSALAYRTDGSTVTIPNAPAAPTMTTLGQTAGGSLGARTRFARICYFKNLGGGHIMLFPVSAEASFAISANNLLTVASPPANAAYDGWLPLVGSASNGEFVQTPQGGSPFGITWVEIAGGFDTTQSPYDNTNWKSLTIINQPTNQVITLYPYYDLSTGLVQLGVSFGSSADATKATLQVADQHLPLSGFSTSLGSYAFQATVPAAAGANSGSAGGGRWT